MVQLISISLRDNQSSFGFELIDISWNNAGAILQVHTLGQLEGAATNYQSYGHKLGQCEKVLDLGSQ